MTKNFAKLGSVLDASNYLWLLQEHEAIATALEAEVLAGGNPEAIGRYVARQIGESRSGLVNRVISAARHLASRQSA